MQPKGFAAMDKERHKQVSSLGGKKRGILKGTATLSATERRERAIKAAHARWDKVRSMDGNQ